MPGYLPSARLILCGFVYLLGWWGFSWVAFIVILAVIKWITVWGKVTDLHDRNKFHRLKRVATNEKEVVAEFKNLGASWIEFPDKDRVEWINSIFPLLWRHIETFVEELLRCDVEKQVRSASAFLRKFSFGTITLGKQTPRIDGIKTYENTPGQVVMDIDLFYGGDLAVTLKISPGMTLGVSNVMFRGSLRVILAPLLPEPPFVGAVTIFFLKTPLIDLDTKGALLNLPGIESTIENVIMDEISKVLVQPHRIVVPLDDKVDVDALMAPLPVAVLRIGLLKGINLSAQDRGNKSDPYCVIETSGCKFQTEVIKGTVNPEWNEGFTIPIGSTLTGNLELSFFDWDMSSANDPMGNLSLGLDSISGSPNTKDVFMLQEVERGEVEIHWEWLQLTSDKSLLKKAAEKSKAFFTKFNKSKQQSACAIINCIVKSAENLPKNGNDLPSTYVSVGVTTNEKDAVKTRICDNSTDPVWKQGFYFFIGDPNTAVVNLAVHNAEQNNKNLGECRIQISDIYAEPDCSREKTYTLMRCESKASILVSITVRIIIPGNLIPKDMSSAAVILNLGLTYDKESGKLEISPLSAKTVKPPNIPPNEQVSDMVIRVHTKDGILNTTPAGPGQLDATWTDVFSTDVPIEKLGATSFLVEAVCIIAEAEVKLGKTNVTITHMAHSTGQLVEDYALS